MTDASKAVVAKDDDGSKRDEKISVRMTTDERATATAYATSVGLGLGPAMRSEILKAAREAGVK